MAQLVEGDPAIESGLNSSVEYEGHCYHVQTQCSAREAPVVESLVFRGGEVLIRITASYDDIARHLGFTGDDGRHLLQQQHSDLIRKIRRGLLRDDDEPAPPAGGAGHVVDADGLVVDPAEISDPSVRALLHELGVAIDAARPAAPETEPRRPAPEPPAAPRPWWRRLAIRIRLPLRAW